jgi:hypothetical protein
MILCFDDEVEFARALGWPPGCPCNGSRAIASPTAS